MSQIAIFIQLESSMSPFVKCWVVDLSSWLPSLIVTNADQTLSHESVHEKKNLHDTQLKNLFIAN